MSIQVLARAQNAIGTHWGVGAAPPAGATSATLAADMPAAELADATNFLRLSIYADFGAGPKWQATSSEWQGGPGKTAPCLSTHFRPDHPPVLVYGVLEDGTRGAGSPAVCGLLLSFA